MSQSIVSWHRRDITVRPSGFSIPATIGQDDADIYFGALAMKAVRDTVGGMTVSELALHYAKLAVDQLRDTLIAAQVILSADYDLYFEGSNLLIRVNSVNALPAPRISPRFPVR